MKPHALFVLVFGLSLGSGSMGQALSPDRQAALNEIEGYLREVSSWQDRIVPKLASTSDIPVQNWRCQARGTHPVSNNKDGSYIDLGDATDDIVRYAIGNLSERPFEPLREQLSAWASAIQYGGDGLPSLDQFKSQLAAWQRSADRAELLADRLVKIGAAYRSSEERLRVVAVCNMSVSEWDKFAQESRGRKRKLLNLSDYYSFPDTQEADSEEASANRLINEFDKTQDLLLGEFHKSFPLPSLFPEEAHPKSPFDGPVTPGNPDRLWIWTARGSGPVGDGIPAQIGLGNKNGPNVVADRDYKFALKCTGCSVASTNSGDGSASQQFDIPKGERFVDTTIVPGTTKVSVAAESKDLAGTEKPLGGCHESDDLHIATNKDVSEASADGKSTVTFQIIFEGPDNIQATNKQDRIVRFNAPNGWTVIPGQNVVNRGGVMIVAGAPCISSFSVTSLVAGEKSMDARYRDTSATPQLSFLFVYMLHWWDYALALAGALLGALSKEVLWKPRKSSQWRRIVPAVSSIAGGLICFLPAYLWLPTHPQYSPWIIFLCVSTFGGVIGGAAAAKLLKDTFRFKDA